MTAQMNESLLYKGEKVGMFALPLRSYLEKRYGIYFKAPHSFLWRGYVGHWEISKNKLYLIDFVGFSEDSSKLDMNCLFPGESKVFAKWFSGKITIPRGELLYYYHGGFGGIYKEDQILTLENGLLINEELVNNEERARKQKQKDIDFPDDLF
jgi:hypothetical protein